MSEGKERMVKKGDTAWIVNGTIKSNNGRFVQVDEWNDLLMGGMWSCTALQKLDGLLGQDILPGEQVFAFHRSLRTSDPGEPDAQKDTVTELEDGPPGETEKAKAEDLAIV